MAGKLVALGHFQGKGECQNENTYGNLNSRFASELVRFFSARRDEALFTHVQIGQ
jgi:hypothetical protein